eukprot:8897074-Prorocentrum_lima.AAC.1
MTSSLVGSEMCIRDRRTTMPNSAAERSLQVFDSDGVNITPMWKIYHPVSYTHLTLPTICSV